MNRQHQIIAVVDVDGNGYCSICGRNAVETRQGLKVVRKHTDRPTPVVDYADFIAQHETDVADGSEADDDRTVHLPLCTAPLGDDCTCGPIPSDIWCDQGPEDAHFVVVTSSGPHSLCRDHALRLLWKVGSTACNPGIGTRTAYAPDGIPGPVVTTRYREVDNGQTIVTVATAVRR